MSVIPTFQRHQSNTLVSSVIDYIYAGLNIHHTLKDAQVIRLHQSWSDHSILHISFTAGLSPTGPGLWRANPIYASHPALQKQLTDKITKQMTGFEHSTLTPEEKWDKVKSTTKKVIRNYSYTYVDWRTSTIRHLERKRNRILRGKPPMALRTQLITPIDKVLGRLQQELTTIEGLKAGAKWREQGEKSAGFFKRLHQQRTIQQHMTAIQHLDTDPSNETHTSDPDVMREIVQKYYQQLYTTDRVPEVEIDKYLQTINFNRQVDSLDNDTLIAPITLDDLLEQVKRSPNQSSPGQDGLGYQFLNVLFRIPALQPLILEVYNRALTINDIIEPSQTGFIRGRFIGDNGLLLHLVIQQAQFTKYSGLGLLLDQEKAYDRVNPQYLVQVLQSFGFHDKFVRCIHHLFFGNSVQINVNGFFSQTIDQQRGLRQGDPLSPLLFNLALEPLLLAINQDSEIIGYTFFDSDTEHRVKTLAYADDICTILHNVNGYDRVQHHLLRYPTVSNAKFNKHKTEAFSLNGHTEDSWQSFVQRQQISTYHTASSPAPFRYLGYHIIYNASQRVFLQNKLLAEVKDQPTPLPTHTKFFPITTYNYLRLCMETQTTFGFFRSIVLSHCPRGIGCSESSVTAFGSPDSTPSPYFDDPNPQSLVHTAVSHHLSTIAGHEEFNFISLVVPAFRKHKLNQPWSILHAIYNAYDHFDIDHDFSSLSISNQLKLPLNKMLTSIPDLHWLHRHPHFPGSSFFIIDDQTHRLRLRVIQRHTTTPNG
ncbi:hypothetical protein G6F25_012004 [Rhizopus arrhizus]|nr:hypothetical protein G6F25_012004 [Rhizopus arrhizus]